MMHWLLGLWKGPTGMKEISVAELSQQPQTVRRIDVRDADEFEGELGHLEGAELVPLPQLRQLASDWPRDVPLLVICRSGNRSGQACGVLSAMGFSDVTNLRGGMLAVRQAKN